MLNKLNRVTKAKEYSVIFKKTRPIHTDNFVFRFNIKSNSEAIRFGFVVCNKIEKLAVRRNLIKRRLRAIARELINDIKTGYDVVVVAKSAPITLSYDGMKQQFESAIKKNSFFNEKNINQTDRSISKNPIA